MEAFGEILKKIQQPQQSPPDNTVSLNEPEYSCETCRDRPIYAIQSTGPAESDFRQIPVDCPACGERKRTERLWKYSGIATEDMTKTLDTFERKTDKQKAAYQAILDVVAPVSRVDLVLIYGPPGTGKSHLGNAAVLEWIKDKKPARFIRSAEWLDSLRASFSEGGTLTDDLKAELYNAHYLVLDELKCRTAFEWGEMDEIIGRRYDRHFPTIVLTNVNSEGKEGLIANFGRVWSRAGASIQGRIVLLDGEDYRGRE